MAQLAHSSDMDRLSGSVALVTGAESGIGRATVTVLAENGAAVMGVGLRSELGDGLASELRGKHLAGAFVVSDVSTREGANAAVAATVATFGGLSILVNNAAVISFGTIEECSEEDWDRIMRVNLKSVYLVSRAAIPHMRAAGGGSIINVSSAHAYATTDHVAAYATSKAAVLGLTRQMAIDFVKDGIRVNAVLPGGTDTAMARQHLAFMGRDASEATARPEDRRIGRVAQPTEIARAILFLASPDASFITGTPLVVDGGQLARSAG